MLRIRSCCAFQNEFTITKRHLLSLGNILVDNQEKYIIPTRPDTVLSTSEHWTE